MSKKIEIQMVATGGQQVAAEIQKTSQAIEDAGTAAKASAPDVSDLTEKLDEMRERASDLAEQIEETGHQQQSFTRKINLGRAASVGAGIGGAILIKSLREIASSLQSIDVDKLRGLDAAMADQVETAARWGDALTNPIGAIQRLISGDTISGAFEGINDQLTRNAQMQEEAVDRLISSGRATAKELTQVSSEIAAANALLAATAAANASVRDLQDAERIRAGANKEDVAIDRAAFDRDQQLEQINAGLLPASATTQALFEDSRIAATNAENVRSDPRATTEQIKEAQQKAIEAEAAFTEAKKQYDNALAIANQQRVGVRAEYENTVRGAASSRDTRLSREAEQEKNRQEAQRRKDEQAARTAQLRSLEGSLAGKEKTLDDAAETGGMQAINAGMRQGNSTLQNIGNKLADGTDAAELERIALQIYQNQGKLGAANVSALQTILKQLQEQATQIENLKGQIKTTRNGR
jgi:hypothetical protein